MKIEDIARVTHTANKGYCETLGDYSQTHWEAAPQWQKDSAIKGVIFLVKNPSAKPSDSHDSWMAEKRREGWDYGPVKDPIKRQHPCMVEYSALPQEQQAKDHIFRAIVLACVPFISNEDFRNLLNKED